MRRFIRHNVIANPTRIAAALTEALLLSRRMQCDLSAWAGPPVFHRYGVYCNAPHMHHDGIRDLVYSNPLPHVASQLLGAPQVRLSNSLIMGQPDASRVLPRRWHADYHALQGAGSCDNVVVAWLPLEHSCADRNGLVLVNGSHHEVAAMVADGMPKMLPAIPRFRTIGEAADAKGAVVSPTLELGDAVLFSKCTVHAASGINTARAKRMAFQMRFASSPVTKMRGSEGAGALLEFPYEGEKFAAGGEQMGGVGWPRLWPSTLPEEDKLRAAGPLYKTRLEWCAHLLCRSPAFLAVSGVARALDSLIEFGTSS